MSEAAYRIILVTDDGHSQADQVIAADDDGAAVAEAQRILAGRFDCSLADVWRESDRIAIVSRPRAQRIAA